MKHSKSLIFGVACSLMISLLCMSSCAQNQSKGNSDVLELYETYEASQFLPIMVAIDEGTIGKERQFSELLSGMAYAYGPVVGTAFYNDTAAINAILNEESSKSMLPSDVRFAWTAYPSSPRSGLYQLIALKTNDGKPAMYGDLIKNAKVEIEPLCNEAFVLIEFNKQATEQWANLTEMNIGRSIAIVIEGKVYFYPTVQEQITVGKCQIFAPWDEEEANELVKKLMSK